MPKKLRPHCDEAATFGYPRARSFLNSGSTTFGYPRQAPCLTAGDGLVIRKCGLQNFVPAIVALPPKIAAKTKNKVWLGNRRFLFSSARDSPLFQSPERFCRDRRP
jgi:hypothetical protein